jgi:NarL family two-component system response regulator YdfI
MYKTTAKPFQSAPFALKVDTTSTRVVKQAIRGNNKSSLKTDKQAINVLLVDTHILMLTALMRVVATFPQVRIVRHLQTTEEMLAIVERTPVDVVIFGVSIPVSKCLQFTHSMNESHRELGIVIIQPHLRAETALTIVQQGIHGLLDEFASEQDLADAISTVATGSTFFSRYAREILNSSISSAALYLTARELEVVSLLMRGTSNFRIAQSLGLKEKTIEAYLTNIYSKLGVKSRTEAIICLQDLQI